MVADHGLRAPKGFRAPSSMHLVEVRKREMQRRNEYERQVQHREATERTVMATGVHDDNLTPFDGVPIQPPSGSDESVKPADLVERIDHVGFCTDDVKVFEKFWCGVLGFTKCHDGYLPKGMSAQLFGLPEMVRVCRYTWGPDLVDIELHVFPQGVCPAPQHFNRFGIAHLCFHVKDREGFIKMMPDDVTVHRYHNPGGWQNIFIRDLEGNWIELRTKL